MAWIDARGQSLSGDVDDDGKFNVKGFVVMSSWLYQESTYASIRIDYAFDGLSGSDEMDGLTSGSYTVEGRNCKFSGAFVGSKQANR